jgi:hypothetical protein
LIGGLVLEVVFEGERDDVQLTAVVSVPASRKLKPSPERRYMDFSSSGRVLDSIRSANTLPFSGWSKAFWM